MSEILMSERESMGRKPRIEDILNLYDMVCVDKQPIPKGGIIYRVGESITISGVFSIMVGAKAQSSSSYFELNRLIILSQLRESKDETMSDLVSMIKSGNLDLQREFEIPQAHFYLGSCNTKSCYTLVSPPAEANSQLL